MAPEKMRAGDRNKYAARNVRHDSQRIRVVLIVMGCFLMTMTFIFSTKPGAVSIENSNLDEAQSFPPKKMSHSQDVELQITQIREDFESNNVETQIEPPKEPTNFGAVGRVDLELPMDRNKEDSQLDNAKTEMNPAEQTKFFGDVDSESQFTRTDVESQHDVGQSEPNTENITFSDAGENTEFEKVVEGDSEQNTNLQTTLIDGTNLEETKNEPSELENEEDKENNSEDDETKPAQIPTLLDRFNENQVGVKPVELEKFANGEKKENDNETEGKEARIPTLLDHFNDDPTQAQPNESEQSGGEKNDDEQWIVKNPEKTEETTSSNQFGGENNGEQWVVTEPQKTEETTGSNQFGSENNGEQLIVTNPQKTEETINTKQFGGENNDQQWIVTNPQKTEETTSSNQFGSEKNDQQWFVTDPRKAEETTSSSQFEITKAIPSPTLQCDFTDFRSDTCNLEGDIRIHGNSSTIYFVDPAGSSNQFYNIKPYPRKGDEMCYQRVQQFNVTSRNEAPQCTQSSDVPAILFSIGGYTGNIFHDFSDVIMPLFTASRSLNGHVQFLMTDTQTWWLIKYDKILKALSHFEPIRLDVDDANNEVYCFKHVIVGLVAHRELIIEPLRNPNHYSTQDFTRFLRQISPLEREAPTHLGEPAMNKPRMLIISRARSRMITNLYQLVGLGHELGFEVLVQETDVGNDIIQFARVINSCDVMIGVHGAGLTNEMFLPPNGTLIQIVPYGGLEWIGQMDYGDPAIAMGLNYIQYSIALEESSLLEKYGRDNEILKNPIEFHKRGFVFIHEFFMNGQNITLDLNKFRNVLITTLDKLTN